MRRIPVDSLKPGMTVARNVINSSGQILACTGASISTQYIQYLKELGILSVYVSDEQESENELVSSQSELISEQLRVDTVRFVKNSFQDVTQFRRIDTSQVQKTVSRLLDDILSRDSVLVSLADIRTHDDYIFGHSVNVCVMSLVTGITMGLDAEHLKELGIGALLHDIGKLYIPPNILNKPLDLEPWEYEEVQKHTRIGFELLRQHDDLTEPVMLVAHQHHERWNGQGYPQKLGGTDIHQFARIVAVADTYDALMADRPYRSSYTLGQTTTIIDRLSGIQLDPCCVEALLSNLAVYPIGGLVELNTGSIAMVMSVNKACPGRPIVKILFDRYGKKLEKPYRVDLAPYPSVMIKRNLNETECAAFIACA